jgi:small-conductance mechanosensitive channel
MIWSARRLLVVLLCGLGLGLFFSARVAADEVREQAIAKTVSRLAAVEDAIARGQTNAAAADLRAVIAEARSELAPIAEDIARAEGDVKALGAPPKEGEPPEAAALASERATLTGKLSTLLAQRTRLSAAIEQANGLLSQISRRRLQTFYAALATQDAPLISPRLWAAAMEEWRRVARDLSSSFNAWRAATSKDGGAPLNFALVAAAALLSLLLFGPADRAARRMVVEPLHRREPTAKRRLVVAAVKVLSRLAPGFIAGAAIIGTARATGLLPGPATPVAEAMWIAVIGWLVAQGFLSGLFAPSSPAWRLSAVGEDRARIVGMITLAIIALCGATIVAKAVAAAFAAPSMLAAVKGASAAIIGGLIIALSLRRHWRAGAASEDRWTLARRCARLFGVALIAAAVAGYVRLADFAASRIYFGALLFALLWALRAALNEAAGVLDLRLRRRAADASTDESADRRAALYWVGVAIDAFLILLLIPASLALAGWTVEGVRDLTLRALSGVRIGGAVISVGDLLVALGAFVGLLGGTRLLQGAVQRGPLAHSRIDRGVQDSLITLLGYAGLLIAIVTGVSILGVDLSSLALIAGALSVGVGLGLQGVVNNFVSGLILLFERPIKVGDWIVTQSGQGIVKKISVRSTEIETFEKSSIIVPNSELISSAVTNYTHRNSLGRVTVPVSVAYSADPRAVHDILLDCARGNPLFLIDPAPFVIWKNFGAAALEFEVNGFLADIGKGPQARNELRFAIFEAFARQGVSFPRQDVYLHQEGRT